jgi:diacylglycerol O-acyltransferase / wax synthase
MQQLNTMDSAFYYMDQRGPGMSMAMLQVFSAAKGDDPLARYEAIAERVEKAIPAIPMLHQRIFRVPGDMDKPYWVADREVDINYHIRHLALPPPGNWDQLTEIYEQLCSLPLDMEAPLWRVYVIEGLDGIEGLPAKSFAVVTKMHHASADGITAAKVTSVIAGAPIEDMTEGADNSEGIGNIYDLMAKSVANNLNSSFKLGREYLSNLSSISRWTVSTALGGLFGSDKAEKVHIPKTRFNETLSPDRIFDSLSLDKKEVSALRARLNGATVTDVALCVCGGALREYLSAQRELPQESLAALMPVSVRSDEVGGNQFSVTRILLATDINDPLERLEKIREQNLAAKESLKSEGGEKFKELSNLVPGPLLSFALSSVARFGLAAKLPPVFNVMISSVPGSPTRIKSGDNELVYMNGSPPIMDGVGLLFGILGYDKNIVISITTCKKMVPDKAFMVSCLRSSYEHLVTESRKQAPPKKARKPARRKKPAAKKAPRKKKAAR